METLVKKPRINPHAQIFNTLTPEVIKNPYPYYKKLRDSAPLALLSSNCWIATGYQEVDSILKNKKFGSNFWKNKILHYGQEAKLETSFSSMADWIILRNNPDHRQLRGILAPYFDHKTLQFCSEKIKNTANKIIDSVINHKKMDLINDYATPLSQEFVYEILDVPINDRLDLYRNTKSVVRLLDPPKLSRDELDEQNSNINDLQKYAENLFKFKKNNSILSLLENACAEHKMTKQDAINQVVFLLIANFDTTPNTICNGLVALHQHPTQLNYLKEAPMLTAEAINELLRYDTSFQMISREAFEDVEMDDYVIKKGEKVITILGATNRDPLIFNDPDRLDLTREKKRILSFSNGIHSCLGRHLAHIQVQVAFETLLLRIPDLKINNVDQLEWKPSCSFRALKNLTISW